MRPGQPVPLQAAINGAPARLACNSTRQQVADTVAPPALLDASETRMLESRAPACTYFPSSWLTPLVTTATVMASPTTAWGVLQLNGSLLTNSTADIAITVGDAVCVLQAIAGESGSASCLLPDLTAGLADVVVTVQGAGAATMPGGGPTLRLMVPLSVSRSVVPARASMFGGVTLTVNGSGFGIVAGSNSTCEASSRCNSTGMSVAVVGALPGPVEPVLLSSSVYQATIRIPPFVATSTAASFQLNLQVRVFERAGNKTVSTATFPLALERSLTPGISSISPRELQPYTAANITLTWTLTAAGAAAALLGNSTQSGTPSAAAISFQASPSSRTISCMNATVLTSNLSTSQYEETVSCAVGADMPAASFGVWLCLPSLGCGFLRAGVQVNATVTSISAASGSTAGGNQLVVNGTGELFFGRRLVHALSEIIQPAFEGQHTLYEGHSSQFCAVCCVLPTSTPCACLLICPCRLLQTAL